MPRIEVSEIDKILATYDENKSWFCRIFGDDHGIRKLKTLRAANDESVDCYTVVKGFIESPPIHHFYYPYNSPLLRAAEFKLFIKALFYLLQGNLENRDNLDPYQDAFEAILKLLPAVGRGANILFGAISLHLYKAGIYTRGNFDTLLDHPNGGGASTCLRIMQRCDGALTQRSFDSLMVTSNQWLFSTQAYKLFWLHIPKRALASQLVFRQLIEYVRAPNFYPLVRQFLESLYPQSMTVNMSQGEAERYFELIREYQETMLNRGRAFSVSQNQLESTEVNAPELRISAVRQDARGLFEELMDLASKWLQLTEINEPESLISTQSLRPIHIPLPISYIASRLQERYDAEIAKKGVRDTVNELKQFVNSLSDENEINQGAKRCIDMAVQAKNNYLDPQSQVSSFGLLALSYIALCDETTHATSSEDAKQKYIQQLYDIYRTYCLTGSTSDLANDNNDKVVCSKSGFFSILNRKLNPLYDAENDDGCYAPSTLTHA